MANIQKYTEIKLIEFESLFKAFLTYYSLYIFHFVEDFPIQNDVMHAGMQCSICKVKFDNNLLQVIY